MAPIDCGEIKKQVIKMEREIVLTRKQEQDVENARKSKEEK